MKTNWHHYIWKVEWEPTFGFHMNENQVGESILLLYVFLKNLIGFLKEPPFGFQNHIPF